MENLLALTLADETPEQKEGTAPHFAGGGWGAGCLS
jgi:hypothetical protein